MLSQVIVLDVCRKSFVSMTFDEEKVATADPWDLFEHILHTARYEGIDLFHAEVFARQVN